MEPHPCWASKDRLVQRYLVPLQYTSILLYDLDCGSEQTPHGREDIELEYSRANSLQSPPEPLETRNHLFYQCKFSEEVWKNLTAKLLSLRYTTDWDEVVRLLTDQTWNSTRLFLLRYVFQETLSALWTKRNGRRHGERSNTLATLIKSVDKAVRNRIFSSRVMEVSKYTKAMETWFSVRWKILSLFFLLRKL